MMLDPIETDPFILLVHHRHRFDFWDPIRPLFRLLLPEVCLWLPIARATTPHCLGFFTNLNA